MNVERRRSRSDEPTQAARLYLQAMARRNAHEALALADGDGLLVLDVPSEIDGEAVAAVAPLAYAEHAGPEGLLGLVTRGRPLKVWPVELEGSEYYLAAVGGAEELGDAPAALQRILA